MMFGDGSSQTVMSQSQTSPCRVGLHSRAALLDRGKIITLILSSELQLIVPENMVAAERGLKELNEATILEAKAEAEACGWSLPDEQLRAAKIA